MEPYLAGEPNSGKLVLRVKCHCVKCGQVFNSLPTDSNVQCPTCLSTNTITLIPNKMR